MLEGPVGLVPYFYWVNFQVLMADDGTAFLGEFQKSLPSMMKNMCLGVSLLGPLFGRIFFSKDGEKHGNIFYYYYY